MSAFLSMDDLPEEVLEVMAARAAAATPGPSYVNYLDDDHAMSLIAVSTNVDTQTQPRWPGFDYKTMVAATLVQQPRYVDHEGERWEEDANFIAHAREDIPRLIKEVRRLRQEADNGLA